MKLAIIADTFPPLRSSGAVQLHSLAQALVDEGHSVTVFLPAADLNRQWSIEVRDSIRIAKLKAPPIKDIHFARRLLNEWRMSYAMRRAMNCSPIAGEIWDGVIWYSPSIFHTPFVRYLKRRSGCMGYLIVRDIFPEWAADLGLLRRGLLLRLLRRVAKAQYEAADAIGVQTAGNLAYFHTWRRDYPRRTLQVLQNWLGSPGEARCSIRLEGTPLAARRIFVYAGNMGVAQGLGILLHLAERLQSRSDIGFLFVGRGRDAAKLRQWAIARGIRNTLFYDEIDAIEIPDLYRQCHAGLVALDRRHRSHNIPGKFLTYMQSGLPVLAIVNPGNDLASMIRRERVGEVCEVDDTDELHIRALSLIDQIESDLELPARCRKLFDRTFAVDQAVRQIVTALLSDDK